MSGNFNTTATPSLNYWLWSYQYGCFLDIMCAFCLFQVFESFKDYVATEQLDGDNKYDAGEHGLQVRLDLNNLCVFCVEFISVCLHLVLCFIYFCCIPIGIQACFKTHFCQLIKQEDNVKFEVKTRVHIWAASKLSGRQAGESCSSDSTLKNHYKLYECVFF